MAKRHNSLSVENPETASQAQDIPKQEPPKNVLDRRRFLGSSSAVLLTAALAVRAEAQGAQDIEKIARAQHDKSASNIGPENQLLKDANTNTFTPPPTDQSEVESFWNSFSVAHRRIQEGGWSRQVTVSRTSRFRKTSRA